MEYEYGVEYETNGEKPNLPDDVLVNVMFNGKWKDWGNYCNSVGVWVWSESDKFRIVDERYKPAPDTSVGSIEQFFVNMDSYAELVGATKINVPKVYGHWVIGNFCIVVDKQLTPEQIKNTEDLLGWKWEPKGE